MACARFDKDTQESFINLYTKVDADAGATVAEAAHASNAEALESADRVDLDVPFEAKDEVKSKGAKWDKDAKKWYVTGDQYRSDVAYWGQWSPSAVTADNAKCPF